MPRVPLASRLWQNSTWGLLILLIKSSEVSSLSRKYIYINDPGINIYIFMYMYIFLKYQGPSQKSWERGIYREVEGERLGSWTLGFGHGYHKPLLSHLDSCEDLMATDPPWSFHSESSSPTAQARPTHPCSSLQWLEKDPKLLSVT